MLLFLVEAIKSIGAKLLIPLVNIHIIGRIMYSKELIVAK